MIILTSNRAGLRNIGRGSGFTLVELLVVILIIAILAAILFPVFGRAKQQAKTGTTIVHVKQLGAAFQLYQTDDDEFNPSATDGFPGESRLGGWVWYDAFHFNRAGHFDVTKGSIYPYVRDERVYYDLNHAVSEPSLSFAMNSCLIQSLSGTGLTGGKSSSEVGDPSQTMLLGEEGTGLGEQKSDSTNDGYFAALFDHFSAWHTGGTAILFTDSHAKILNVQSDQARMSVTTGVGTTKCDQ